MTGGDEIEMGLAKRLGLLGKLWAHVSFCLLLTLSGCGTLGGVQTIVSLDSQKRGQPVYDRGGRYIGKTPIFVSLTPQPRFVLYTGVGLEQTRHSVSCDFGWWQTPLENLPLVLVTGPLFAGSLGVPMAIGVGVLGGSMVDTVKGAAFRCPHRIVLSSASSESQSQAPLKCGLMFPPSYDQTLVNVVKQQWAKSGLGQKLCSEYIGTAEIIEQAKVISLPERLDDLDETDRVKVYRFGYETGIDRLIRFEPLRIRADSKNVSGKTKEAQTSEAHAMAVPNDGMEESNAAKNDGSDQLRIRVRTTALSVEGAVENTAEKHQKESMQLKKQFVSRVRITDLHRLKLIESKELALELPLAESEALRRGTMGQYALKYFSLIPDAFAVATGWFSIDGVGKGGTTPVGNFNVTKISHPSGFRRWDYQFSVAPELMVDIQETHFRLDSDMPVEDDEVALSFRRFGAGFTGFMDFHTPLGATGLGLFLGGLFVDAGQPTTSDYSGVLGTRIRHTVFLSKRVFTQFTLDVDTFDIQLRNIELESSITGRLQLGMYFPELEPWARSLF